MPYTPPHQDISVTLAIYEKDKLNPEAASRAFLSINDELSYRGWFEKYDKSPDSLPPEVQTFFYVLYADNEVNNGGFAQYFFNGYGIYAEGAVKAYKAIGAAKKAALLAAVMASFHEGNYPKTVEEYEDLNNANEDNLEFLNNSDFDTQYYDSNEKIDELMIKYIQQHFDKFAP